MPTVFDQLYEQLFGTKCTKEGEAFERIAAAVTQIIFPHADVAHNQKLRGKFSKSLYQIDVLRQESGQPVLGEAKDYTERGDSGGKVGRPDLQKLAGALPDVGADQGVFYSATDFSREARKYAAAAQQIVGARIDLMHVRPSVAQDEQGRINKIVLNMHITVPDYSNAQWEPVITEAGKAALVATNQKDGEYNLLVDTFYDQAGATLVTIQTLTSQGFSDADSDGVSRGEFALPSHYLNIFGASIEVSALRYAVPMLMSVESIEIVAEGTPMILVKDENGKINKLITDKQLQGLEFDENGNIRP